MTSEKLDGSAGVLILVLAENKLVDWVKLAEVEFVALVMVEVLGLLVLVLCSWG